MGTSVLLFVLVIGLPLIYGLQAKGLPLPGFCKYICPAGTFEGAIMLLINKANTSFFDMLGVLFTWKFLLLILFIVASVFIYRVFCRFFCPLGAIYGLFNKLSILGIKVEKSKCNHCNACINNCKMDVKEVGDHECIQCGDCMKSCGCKAIKWKMISQIIKEDEEKDQQENNNQAIIDESKSKKVFKISKKNFNIITYVLMIVTLTTAIVLTNLGPRTYKTFDVVEELNIICSDTQFDLSTDTNSTLLYFYDDESNLNVDAFKKFANEKLNIILISANSSDKLNQEELKQYNILLGIDSKNKLLKEFSSDKTSPYSVFLDFNDKILINHNGMISDTEYFEIINYTLLGLTVGNEVGNICINKEIGVIGSDKKFSVAKNRGKVTIINFWFTTCTPCVQELPHFNEVYLEYRDYIEVIAIHEATGYKNNPEEVEKFINTQFEGFSIKFGYDDVSDQYYKKILGTRSQAWPMTVIVNSEGVITNVITSSLTKETLINEIERSLNLNG